MSHPIVKPLAGLVITAALGVGLSWVIGRRIEADIRALIAEAPDHYPYPVRLLRYERGLFSSVAETEHRYDLGPDPGAITVDDNGQAVLPPNRIVPLTLLHRISHGPRLDGLRLARIINTVKFDGDLQDRTRRLFGDAEPVQLTVDLGIGGGISGELLSPAVDARLPGDGDAASRHLQWSGIRGRFDISGDHVVGSLDAPGLDLDDGGVVMGPVAVKTDLTLIADGVLIGRVGSSFASFSHKGPAGVVALSGIHIDADTADSDGQLKSTTTMAIRELRFNDTRVSDAQLRMVFDRFGTQAMSDLSLAINRFSAQQVGKPADEAQAQQMLAAIKPSLAAAAADQPIFAIEDLSFTAPQGKLQFSGKVQYVGDANLDDFTIRTDVAADAKLAMPVALIDLLLTLQAAKVVVPGAHGEPVHLSPEQIAAFARSNRDGAVAKGMLVVEGDLASTAVQFRDGALIVNGKPFGAAPP
ncbi:YdgA family protein [Nevskia sp.]|uniref:YdgA family protein n=1 Tax=Nevskia sp. TaxID=1929292 RepID=UPI003F7285D4